MTRPRPRKVRAGPVGATVGRLPVGALVDRHFGRPDLDLLPPVHDNRGLRRRPQGQAVHGHLPVGAADDLRASGLPEVVLSGLDHADRVADTSPAEGQALDTSFEVRSVKRAGHRQPLLLESPT